MVRREERRVSSAVDELSSTVLDIFVGQKLVNFYLHVARSPGFEVDGNLVGNRIYSLTLELSSSITSTFGVPSPHNRRWRKNDAGWINKREIANRCLDNKGLSIVQKYVFYKLIFLQNIIAGERYSVRVWKMTSHTVSRFGIDWDFDFGRTDIYSVLRGLCCHLTQSKTVPGA